MANRRSHQHSHRKSKKRREAELAGMSLQAEEVASKIDLGTGQRSVRSAFVGGPEQATTNPYDNVAANPFNQPVGMRQPFVQYEDEMKTRRVNNRVPTGSKGMQVPAGFGRADPYRVVPTAPGTATKVTPFNPLPTDTYAPPAPETFTLTATTDKKKRFVRESKYTPSEPRGIPALDRVIDASENIRDGKPHRPPPKKPKASSDWPLMDRFHQATFSKKENAQAQRVLAALRVKLKQAQRYILDDDAVRLNCHLSHEKSRIAGWSNLARIPYDTMWLEYDLHTEMREFEKMGVLREAFEPDEVSQKVGYFFYKDNDDPQSPKWVCHEIQIHSDDTVGTCTIAYVFDPEGYAGNPVQGSQTWRSPTLSLLPGFKGPSVPHRNEQGEPCECSVVPEAMLCGAYILTHGGPDTITDPENYPDGAVAGNPQTPHWFRHRAGAIVDPFWARVAEDTKRNIELHRMLRNQCIEQSAVMRRIITLLAAINGLPRDVRPMATRVGKAPMGMTMQPFFTHNMITLQLPRDDRVVWARKTLDHQFRNEKRKRHGVSGHWRIVERGKPLPPYFCHHEPEMVDKGLAICAKCEMIIRWIPQHFRGDASKGWVDHTYRVKAKRQTTKVELGLPHDFPADLAPPVQDTIYSEPSGDTNA